MNSMDFMQGINDIDEELIQSSMDFLQEDSMKQTFKRGGSALSKIILVAAVLAGLLGVTAVAAEAFPSVFGQLKREYAQKVNHLSDFPEAQEAAQKEADLFEKAAEFNETFEAQIVQLPELDESQITIGETYYDGKNMLIAYRMDSSVTGAQFGFGPGSEGFENLHGCRGDMEAGKDSFEELLERGVWTQEYYDNHVQIAKERGWDYIHHVSGIDALDGMKQVLSEEEFARAIQELEETGHVGVVIRVMSIGDHILAEGEDCLVPNNQGYVWWEDVTEYGKCIKSDAFDESLPEKFRDLDTLTLTLKVRADDYYFYVDVDKGGGENFVSVGEILVPVTLTKTPQ